MEEELIKISKELRNRKDSLKDLVKKGQVLMPDTAGEKIIIPGYNFRPGADLQSDQWYFNGFVIELGGNYLVVDPGVDFYSRFINAGLDPLRTSGIFVSHAHIDHTGSLEMFLEKTYRNQSKEISVFITQTGFNDLRVYHKEQLENKKHIKLYLVSEADHSRPFKWQGNDLKLVTLRHSIQDTFGFTISLKNKEIGYLSDTGYASLVKTQQGTFKPEEIEGEFVEILEKNDSIKEAYKDAEVVVVNINDLQYNRHSQYHLSGFDVRDIFTGAKLKHLIIHHLSPINADGEDSNYLYKLFFRSQSYQVKVPHPWGMTFDIASK